MSDTINQIPASGLPNSDLEALYNQLSVALNDIGPQQESIVDIANTIIFQTTTSLRLLNCDTCRSPHLRPDHQSTTSENVSILLHSDSSQSLFSWDDLFFARLMIDTEYAECLHYSKEDGFVRIEVRHSSDRTRTPGASCRQQNQKRRDLFGFLRDMALSTAKSVDGFDLGIVGRIDSVRALNHLFGLSPNATSISRGRRHLHLMGYATRRAIIKALQKVLHDDASLTLSDSISKTHCQRAYYLATRSHGLDHTVESDPTSPVHITQTMPGEKRRGGTTLSPHGNVNKRLQQDGPPLNIFYTTCTSHDLPPLTGQSIVEQYTVEQRTTTIPPTYFHTANSQFFSRFVSDMKMTQPPCTSICQMLRSSQQCQQTSSPPLFPKTAATTESLPSSLTEVQVIELTTTEPSKVPPLVFSAYPFISVDLKSRLLSSLDSALFMEGRQGRNGSFLRCPSSDYNPKSQQFFQIGNTFYSTCAISDDESLVLNLFNDFASAQNSFFRSMYPQCQPAFPTLFNSLQIIISCLSQGSGYKEHDDFGRLVGCVNADNVEPHEMVKLTSDKTDSLLRLPCKPEFQTPTLVLTTDDDQSIDTHSVTWTYDGQHVGSINTNGNLFHFQAHGSQDGFLHSVKLLPLQSSGRATRVVISGRFIVPLSKDYIEKELIRATPNTTFLEANDYRFTNVISCLQSGSPPLANFPPQPLMCQVFPANVLAVDTNMQNLDQKAFDGGSTPLGELNEDSDTSTSSSERYQSSSVGSGFEDSSDEEEDVSECWDDDNESSSEDDVDDRELHEYVVEDDTDMLSLGDRRNDRFGEDKALLCPPGAEAELAAGDENNPDLVDDTYPSIPFNEFKKFRVHRNRRLVIERGEDTRTFIFSAPTLKKLVIEHGIVPFYTEETEPARSKAKPTGSRGREKVVSSLFGFVPPTYNRGSINSSVTKPPTILEPFCCKRIDYVTSEGGLKHSNRAHPPTSGNEWSCPVIIVTKPYKNHMPSIQKYIRCKLLSGDDQPFFLDEDGNRLHDPAGTATASACHSDSSPIPEMEEFDDNTIAIYGSGGSATMSDQFGCDLNKASKHDALARMASHQRYEDSAQTRTLLKLSQRDSVVALFISLPEFHMYLDETVLSIIHSLNPSLQRPGTTNGSAEHDCPYSNQALFLGYFWVEESRQMPPLSVQAIQQFLGQLKHTKKTRTGCDKTDKCNAMNVGFFTQKHWRFKLKMLFDKQDDMSTIRKRNTSTTCKEQWLPLRVLVDEPAGKKGALRHQRPKVTISRSAQIRQLVSFTSSTTSHYLGQEEFTQLYVEQKIEPMISRIGNFRCPTTVLTLLNDCELGTQVKSLDDAIRIVAMVNVCGCMRYLREAVMSVGLEARSCPLCDERLPSILGLSTMPMAARCLDVMTLALRASAMMMGILREDDPCSRSLLPIDPDLFFQAVLNRMTGRPKVFNRFQNRKVVPEAKSSLIPSRRKVGSFLLYLKLSPRAFRKLFNSQHEESLPRKLRNDFSTYQAFVHKLQSTTDKLVQAIMAAALHDRNKALSVLTEGLRSMMSSVGIRDRSGGKERDRTRFVSGQILADLEEIYVEPFGVVSIHSVPIGHGGQQGLAVIREYGIDSLSRLSSFFGELVTAAKASLPLRTMFCIHLDKDGDLAFMLNQRKLNLVDAEHMCCKLYVCLAKTISTRARSKQPKSAKGGHHPVNFHPYEVPWDEEFVSHMCQDAVKAFRDGWDSGSFKPAPSICRLPGEPRRNCNGTRLFA